MTNQGDRMETHHSGGRPRPTMTRSPEGLDLMTAAAWFGSLPLAVRIAALPLYLERRCPVPMPNHIRNPATEHSS